MPNRWVLQLTCCDRDYETVSRETWEEADELRESFLSVKDGHVRTAVIIGRESELVTP